MNLAERAAADLRLVATYWPGLAELRDPQAARPYRTPAITAERRAELDHEARLERAERTNLMPGEHPDAARADVLDLMVALLIDAEQLAERVSLAAWAPVLPPPSTAFADPTPYLERAAAYLPAVDLDVTADVAHQARAMLAQLGRALTLTYDGQRLDVICPWCQGRTDTAPVGGAKTWRVRDLLAALRCEHGKPERLTCQQCPQNIAIVCDGGMCDPPSKDVGTWWRGMPAWPIYEWDWLAKQVTAAEQRERMSA